MIKYSRRNGLSEKRNASNRWIQQLTGKKAQKAGNSSNGIRRTKDKRAQSFGKVKKVQQKTNIKAFRKSMHS